MGLDTRQVDTVLNRYFPEREGDLIYQLFQEDQDQALLLAILMELREQNGRLGHTDDSPPDYEVYRWLDLALEPKEHLEWNFDASEIWYVSGSPIDVAFKNPERHPDAWIWMPQGTQPSESGIHDDYKRVIPPDGITADELWVRAGIEASDIQAHIVVWG